MGPAGSEMAKAEPSTRLTSQLSLLVYADGGVHIDLTSHPDRLRDEPRSPANNSGPLPRGGLITWTAGR